MGGCAEAPWHCHSALLAYGGDVGAFQNLGAAFGQFP